MEITDYDYLKKLSNAGPNYYLRDHQELSGLYTRQVSWKKNMEEGNSKSFTYYYWENQMH